MSFDDELSSHIEHEYYDEIRPWRSAFGYPYGLLPASHVNDGLLCATDYCRYLPLRYEAINPKVSNTYRPPWMSASRNPPFRFKSFIVPRGDVLLEFDIQWLTKKFLILQLEYDRRNYFLENLKRVEASAEWIEEIQLPWRVAICTAVNMTKAMHQNKPIRKPWRHTTAKEEWARIKKRGYLDPDDGYSISIFDDLPFSTDCFHRNGWDMQLFWDGLHGACHCLNEIYMQGLHWDRHRRVLNTSLHFGQAMRGLRDRPFHRIRGLARSEEHHLAAFLMDLIKRRRQKTAEERKSQEQEQVQRRILDEKYRKK